MTEGGYWKVVPAHARYDIDRVVPACPEHLLAAPELWTETGADGREVAVGPLRCSVCHAELMPPLSQFAPQLSRRDRRRIQKRMKRSSRV